MIDAPDCERALQFAHNKPFEVQPSSADSATSACSQASWEGTPFVIPPTKTQYSLRLLQSPFNLRKYCSFGHYISDDPERLSCDFQLAENDVGGVSKEHFHIIRMD
jgi:hypothetical protein